MYTATDWPQQALVTSVHVAVMHVQWSAAPKFSLYRGRTVIRKLSRKEQHCLWAGGLTLELSGFGGGGCSAPTCTRGVDGLP
jgi:hypothetical protein